MPAGYPRFFMFILVLMLARAVSIFAVYACFRRLCSRYSDIVYCCHRILCAQCMYACLFLCLFYSMDAYIFVVVGYARCMLFD